MSEQNLSYDQIVKQLKPFSVVVTKISAEEFVKLKVVDDPNRIKDEAVLTCSAQTEDEEVEEEEEIEVNLAEAEADGANECHKDDSRQYMCFFCKKSLMGYANGFQHFQLHIDYYPIQCSVCDEANTDLIAFVRHCRKTHPELENAKYIRKYNSICFDWIHNFLITEANPTFKDNPQKYCPACDWIHLSDPDVNNPNESTPALKPMRILRHIHEHIRYMPFSCIKCTQIGQNCRLHVLGNTTRKHITSEHKELLNDPPFWKFFSKKYTIPSLDKFVSNYLSIFGLKMPKNRIKISKSKTELMNRTNVETKPKNNYINSALIAQTSNTTKAIAPKPEVQRITTVASLMVPALNQSVVNGNQLITYTIQPNITQMENPFLLYPSNDKLNMNPIPVESTDIGIVYIDPNIIEIDPIFCDEFKYICVFCDEEKSFVSKTEACVHYAIHFDYSPVVCMLCSKRFLDLSTLMYHYNTEHSDYKNNIFHYLKENEKIEKWINSFVDHQKTHAFKGNVSVIYGDFCFICDKLTKRVNGMRLKCEKNNVKAIRDHIHQHLHYFPYKCSICFHGGRDVLFTALNTSAAHHLLKIHGLSRNGENMKTDFSKLFIKSEEILDLEKFIDNKLFSERPKPETALTLNLKRKLEEIESQSQKRLESTPQKISFTRPQPFATQRPLPGPTPITLSALVSAKVAPIIRQEYNRMTTQIAIRNPNSISYSNSNSISTSTPITYSNRNSMSNSSAVLKVNGMNSTPMRTIGNTTHVKAIEYMPSKNTYIEPFLMCFHCHTRVANTTELKSHHQSKHPKLTIASYAPTKKDLMGLT